MPQIQRMGLSLVIGIALAMLPSWIQAEPVAAPATEPVTESVPVEKDGIRITVRQCQSVIPADQQPDFSVRFTNISPDDINLYDVKSFGDWQIDFTSIDPKLASNPGPWELQMDPTSRRQLVGDLQIKPGESLDIPVDLNDPPSTFKYEYVGPVDALIRPVRHLWPGQYRMTLVIKLQTPFAKGFHEWTGPLTTSPIDLSVTAVQPAKPSAQELAAYDAAIDGVLKTLEPSGKIDSHGLWTNGLQPDINLDPKASDEDITAAAVNAFSLGSKAFRILHIRKIDDEHQPRFSAALVIVGKNPKVMLYFPEGKNQWFVRFFDAKLQLPTTRPTVLNQR